MPKELRQVVFRPEEVVEAISAYYRHRQKKLPTGDIATYTLGDAPVSLKLEIMSSGAPPQEIIIRAEELAAALILHCINHRIPLPADSEKSLRRVGEDNVSLFVVRDGKR